MKKKLPFIVCFFLLASFGSYANPGAFNKKEKQPEPSRSVSDQQPVNADGFIENRGQLRDQSGQSNSAVKYLLNMSGLKVQLRATGFSYDTHVMDTDNAERTLQFHRVDIELEGANPSAKLQASEPVTGQVNRVGPDAKVYGIRQFRKVVYKDIYPGIDLEFVAQQGTDKPVEYNFIVSPGADASSIKLRYKGADNTVLKGAQIKMSLRHGVLNESIPASWIEQTGESLKVRYKALGQDLYAFHVPAYDTRKTLVIDPTPALEWATYYGGDAFDKIYGVDTDPEGNSYVTGRTESAGGIATAGAHQSAYASDGDIFVAKFNSAGQRLWATYYGGTGSDEAFAVTYHNGQLYVGGRTRSDGMSTPGAYQETWTATQTEAILARFDATTGQLSMATYYGGRSGFFESVVVDGSGNVFAMGGPGSNIFPLSTTAPGTVASPGVFREIGGASTSFLVKFNPDGSRAWGTYLAGRIERVVSSAGGLSLQVDAAGDAYVAGVTFSNETSDPDLAANVGEGTAVGAGFIAKISGSNGTRLWGRFFDGAITGLQLDEAGNRLHVTGHTASATGVASAGAYQSVLSAERDGFWASFDLGGHFTYGTYLGGTSGNTYAQDTRLDHEGNIIILGGSNTTGNELATSCAYQPSPAGDYDVFINKFNVATGQRIWGTYYGGAGYDLPGYATSSVFNGLPQGNSLALTPDGRIVVGFSSAPASSQLATVGAHQAGHSGGTHDGVLAMFTTGGLPDNFAVSASTLSPATQQACILGIPAIIQGNAVSIVSPVNYPGNLLYQWQKADDPEGPWEDMPGEVFKDLQPLASQTTLYYRRQVKMCDQEIVATSGVATVEISGNVSPVANADGPQWFVCGAGANTVQLNGSAAGGTAGYSFRWFEGSASGGTLQAETEGFLTGSITQATTFTLQVTDAAGCVDIDQVTVVPAVANAGANQSVCQGIPGVQIGTPPVASPLIAYEWSVISGTPNSLNCTTCAQPVANPSEASVYRLTVTVTQKSGATCVTTDDVTVTPVTAPGNTIEFAGTDKTICKNETVVLGGTNDPTFAYTWTSGQYLNNVHVFNPTFAAGTAAVANGAINYLVTASKDGCSFTDEVKVSVINNRITDQDDLECGPIWSSHLDENNSSQAEYAWSVVSGSGSVLSTNSGGKNAYLNSNSGITTFRRTVTLNGVSCTADISVQPCGPGGVACDFEILTLSNQGCPKVFGDAVLQLGTSLGSAGDFDFAWSPANLVNNATAPTVTITSTAEATISVTITNKYDPSITCTKSILINPPGWALPLMDLTGAICADTPTTIGETPAAGFSYNWSPATGLDRDDIGNPVATLSGNRTYVVRKTEDLSGCTSQMSLNVKVAAPIANAGQDRAVCNGATITLGTPPPSGSNWVYAWEPAGAAWSNGTDASSAQPQVEFAFATPQTYTLTVTDPETGCSATDQVVISNTVGSGEYAGDPVTTCEDVPVELGRAAEPFANYAWFMADGTTPATGLSSTTIANPTVLEPSATTTYVVKVSYPGCNTPMEDQVTLTVNAVPAVDPLTDKTVCSDPVAIGYGAAGNPAAPAEAVSYLWSPAAGLSSATAANPTASVTVTRNYQVTVTLANGCTFTDAVTVTPTSANAGNNATICLGESTQVGVPALDGATYLWTGAGIEGSAAIAQPTVKPSVTTTYTVEVTKDGCTTSDQVTVTVNQPSDFTIAGNTAICEGGVATVGLVGAPASNTAWQWSPIAGVSNPNSATTTIAATTTQTYRLVQTNLLSGCSNFKEVVIVVNPNNIQATTSDVSICPGETDVELSLDVTPAGSYQYVWSPAIGLSDPYSANPTVTTGNSRVYAVTVTDNTTQCQVARAVNFTVRTEAECLLPVTLSSLVASTQEEAVVLSWVTTSESNSYSFDVERSRDGKSWLSLESIAARGESVASVSYRYTDAGPSRGINFYRLKMIDRDGTYAYSRMVSVLFEKGKATLVTEVFPNPASHVLKINTSDWENVKTVHIFNTMGQLQLETVRPESAEIRLDQLKAGLYLIKVIRQDGSATVNRFIIER